MKTENEDPLSLQILLFSFQFVQRIESVGSPSHSVTSRHHIIDVLMLQSLTVHANIGNVMRTTLTLDDDVVFGLEKIKESDRDKSFKEIVNDVLRNGLKNGPRVPRKRFKVKAYNLGLREGLNLDNIEELLDQIEGPNRK